MSYKESDINTGIHTRIDDRARISSAWRTYANADFETKAWETFLWVDEKIAVEYDTLRDAEQVVELHFEIMNKYRNSKREKAAE
ncbi:hypothetical protein [Paenibacillus harenae]|uniref:hypothetical protein n=1 Tax=Paenibacillus harenae TaxID=306543 RepID=UPI002793B46B|nr:hypothetical protein [Paenibacillus harenae]MDQ0062358.1 hypothetical protein [Paenibacillus harenae]